MIEAKCFEFLRNNILEHRVQINKARGQEEEYYRHTLGQIDSLSQQRIDSKIARLDNLLFKQVAIIDLLQYQTINEVYIVQKVLELQKIPPHDFDRREELSNKSLFDYLKENTDISKINELLEPILTGDRYKVLRDVILEHRERIQELIN